MAAVTETEHKLAKAYPRHQTGRFRTLKNAASALLQVVLFVTPWINWNGRQVLLVDLPGRKLHILGWTFWPQETHFMMLILLCAGLTLFFATSILGRLWCGYACPQTLLSHSFILVERLMEGDRFKRLRLDRGPWNREKISKKAAKYSIWFSMSVFLGLTFAGYFTPIRALTGEIVSGNAPWSAVTVVAFFTGVSLFFFGFLRGRFCTTMCPYARLQGSMFDKDTVMVNYDLVRGEPRGKAKDPDTGSCVDCSLCVQVCPQNIDIRDGVQFECINCAACVDACDSVMDKLGQPGGLVRYASEREIEGGKTKLVRPRPVFYGVALLCVVVVFGLLLNGRQSLEMDVVRDAKGGAFSQTADGRVSNLYLVRLINKQSPDIEVELSLEGFRKAELVVPVNPMVLEAESSEVVKVFVLANPKDVPPVHRFQIQARDINNDQTVRLEETTFLRGGL